MLSGAVGMPAIEWANNALVEVHRLAGPTRRARCVLDYKPSSVSSVELKVPGITACAHLALANQDVAPARMRH